MPIELYTKRMKRLAHAGEPDVYQYEGFSEAFRVQVYYILQRVFGNSYDGRYRQANAEIWASIANPLAEELGRMVLQTGATDQEQCFNFLQRTDNSGVLDFIELSFGAINAMRDSPYTDMAAKAQQALSDLNHRFREHSLGFEFLDGQIVRKDSQYIHEEAVKPALSLLNGSSFSGPQDEFLRAHEHLRSGEYQDAIVDANNAFESTMKAICELRKWPYEKTATAKALIGIMFEKQLIPMSMTSHFDHLRLTLETGLPTVRNKTSSHGQGAFPVDVPEYLAAYAVHLAASNIVLLVEAYNALP